MRITDCGRTMAGDYVAFAIRWDGPCAEPDNGTWSMTVTSTDGSESVHLVHERRGGRCTGQYVDDTATGQRHDVPRDADLRDHEITVRFPADVVGVAVEWPVWKAVLTTDEGSSEQLVTL